MYLPLKKNYGTPEPHNYNTVEDSYASVKVAFLYPLEMQFRKIHMYQMIDNCIESM